MADPFSILAGTLGVAEVCLRVARYLKDVRAAAARFEDEMAALLNEVEALTVVNDSVKQAFHPEISKRDDLTPASCQHLRGLWQQTGNCLEDCQSIIKKLDELLQEIYGKTGPKVVGKIDGLGKQGRKRSKEEELRQIRAQLSTCQHRLQILLSGISVYGQHRSQDTLDRVLQELKSRGQDFGHQIASLEDSIRSSNDDAYRDLQNRAVRSTQEKKLLDSVDSVAAALSLVTPNKHFDIPQSVSSIYTGRQAFLQELREIFFAPVLIRQQQRFVIQGIGGSGKTQFCSKFAQDNRDSFWGVFWIDASSQERIKQTFAQIAKIGGVEPNESATLHWLSNLDEPWLLIIDNADDLAVDLETHFPTGDRGHILITTRNPDHTVHGNIGSGHYEFHNLENDDANALLLRAAQHPEPWDFDTSTWAAKITRQLGFLALALTQAGAAIRGGLCTLKNYLQFYDENWIRIRRTRSPSIESAHGADDYMSVYATYEVSYRGIEEKGTESSRDAIQLLKTFAFFYFENIRADVLIKAATNSRAEAQLEEDNRNSDASAPSGWDRSLRAFKAAALSFMAKNRSPASLPHVIRDAREHGGLDHIRLRYALRELVQTSLVMRNEKSDSYSMHPLVHKWARERPEMSTSEQSLWAEVAATTMAHSILLPPLGAAEDDELFRRDLLPHVDHVRDCLRTLKGRLAEARRSRRSPWLGPAPRFDRDQAIRSAKFSLVYVQGGRWRDAETLQRAVKDYTIQALGMDHPATRRIVMALANTLWGLGRGDEAAELRLSVLEACILSLGREDHETLMAMDTLGRSRWQQGRYSDALALQEEAAASLIKVKGRDHEDTLTAMDHLGSTVAKFYEDIERAKRLHSEAAAGMTEVLGPSHSKTLIATENLALIELQMAEMQMPGDLDSACRLMMQVLEQRQAKLGKQHPYTLLAMANLAKIKSAKGEHGKAEELVRIGLPIANRNLGADHIGTLMGRTVLGVILTRQRRFGEAEVELLDVSERQRHLSVSRGDSHPDRIGTMIELVELYKLQGRHDDGIRYCDEAIEALKKISLREHPLTKKIKEQREQLFLLRDGKTGTVEHEEPDEPVRKHILETKTW